MLIFGGVYSSKKLEKLSRFAPNNAEHCQNDPLIILGHFKAHLGDYPQHDMSTNIYELMLACSRIWKNGIPSSWMI